MIKHNNPHFQLVFCDARDNLFPAAVLGNIPYPLANNHEIVRQLAMQVSLDSLMLLKQVHGVQGFCVDESTLPRLSSAPRVEGDFLMTAMPGVGIGVITADCLPLIVYDPENHVAGVAHAGWPGSVARIGERMVQAMRERYGTQPDRVQVFLGPCAHVCCYQVSDDFVEHLALFSWKDTTLQRRENGLFFDVPLFNQLVLEGAGVRREAINRDFSACTICTERFCSYRREGIGAGRQLTCVVLK